MKPRLLLVDDNELNLTTLDAVLSSEVYDLHTATNGHAACEAALRLKPDLVLLDVMMPGMDGYDVCRYIRSQPLIESVPVVMITALNDRQSRIQGLQAGADDFISKPFSLDELRARVRTITRLNRARVIGEGRARFERLFALAPSAIFVLSPEGIIHSANDRADALLDWTSPGEGERKSIIDVLPPEPAAQIAARLDLLFGRGYAIPPPPHLRLQTPEGLRIWHPTLIRLDDSEPLALLSLADVTAEVTAREDAETLSQRLETLVKERTSCLEEANKLLMSYALFVAHDLRSPLSAVKGYLALASASPESVAPGLKSCIQKAAGAALVIEEMINETLALAAEQNQGTPPARLLDPTPSIQKLWSKLMSLGPTPKPTLKLHPLPLIHATPPLLDRVFFNIISNAIKYSSTRPDPMVEIGAFHTSEGPSLYVRDNGVGFPSAEAVSLFNAFSRLSTAEGHEGLGLGLSLVTRLIRAYQGRIWAEGRPGEGATFYVWLPSPKNTETQP